MVPHHLPAVRRCLPCHTVQLLISLHNHMPQHPLHCHAITEQKLSWSTTLPTWPSGLRRPVQVARNEWRQSAPRSNKWRDGYTYCGVHHGGYLGSDLDTNTPRNLLNPVGVGGGGEGRPALWHIPALVAPLAQHPFSVRAHAVVSLPLPLGWQTGTCLSSGAGAREAAGASAAPSPGTRSAALCSPEGGPRRGHWVVLGSRGAGTCRPPDARLCRYYGALSAGARRSGVWVPSKTAPCG